MPRELKVTCDGCGGDLSQAPGQVRYGLQLSVLRIPCHSQVQTAMYILPPIDGDKCFCGLGCLRDWLAGPGSAPRRFP
jgi:hypothetical protein